LGSLAAAVAAVAVLGFLLYGSCKGGTETAGPAPDVAPPAQAAASPRAEERPAAKAPANGAAAAAASEWNDAEIAWQSYDAGLAKAKAENKPVCLVFYTGWCPHCRNYAKVFKDPRVVQKARDFVMVRVNADDEEAVSARHAPDGTYVPRTFFLASDGKPMLDVHAPRPNYIHFYDENNPASVLAGMDAALGKGARPM
jgi:thiol-disulfide isomerase/thioredoxin